MNFDQMSDAELDAYLTQDANFDNMSDAELDAYLTGANTPQTDVVLNEQYAPIQGVDRALIKNFGGDKEGIMNYLHSKHKGSEFKMDGSSVLGRDRGSNEWRKMDVDSSVFSPSTWELQDISDIGTDVASGVAEGAAAITAGTAGSLAGTPLAGLPAGAAAAGATGASLDALKQSIAKSLGTRAGDISAKEALTTGAISTVATPLFGLGGKVANTLAKQNLGKYTKEATKQLTDELIKNKNLFNTVGQKYGQELTEEMIEKRALNLATKRAAFDEGGLVGESGRLLGVGGKKLGAAFNDITEKNIDDYFMYKDVIDNAQPEDITKISRNHMDEVQSMMDSKQQSLSNQYDSLKEVDGTIDAVSIKDPADDIISSLPSKMKADASIKKEVQKYVDNLLELAPTKESKTEDAFLKAIEKQTGQKMPRKKRYLKEMSIAEAIEMRKRFHDGLDSRALETVLEKAGYNKGTIERYIRSISREMTGDLDKQLKGILGDKFEVLNNAYGEFAGKRRALGNFKRKADGSIKYNYAEDLMSKESNAATKKDNLENLKLIEEYLGLGDKGSKIRDLSQAYGVFGVPNLRWMPSSGSGVTGARAIGSSVGSGALGMLGASAAGIGGAAPLALAGLGGMVATSTRGIKGLGGLGRQVRQTGGDISRKLGKDSSVGSAWQRAAGNIIRNSDR